jgi:hypothetical protein
MASPQAMTVVDPLPWSRSTVTRFTLSELVNGGQLVSNVDGQPAAWIVPLATDREPNPPHAYIASFILHHKHGFTAPASCFMRGLCYHCGVELHNFAPKAILEAATFVGVCEGLLGIPANSDLWVHLFRPELHTLTTPEPPVRRAVRVGGMTILLRESRREFYSPCTMTSNNAEWSGGGSTSATTSPAFPLHRQSSEGEGRLLWHGLLPLSRQDQMESALLALKSLAHVELGAASVLANLHHWRIVLLMERELCIYEMSEEAKPVSLAHLQFLSERFLREYAATRARWVVSLKTIKH